MKFGLELGRERFPKNPDGAFEHLVRFGYVLDRSTERYSVAIIPVIWRELMSAFSTVGAGDISSAVLTVFAGK